MSDAAHRVDLEKSRPNNASASPSSQSSQSFSSSEESIIKPKPVAIEANRDLLPEKVGNRATRYVNFNFLTAYRKLFSVIFISNLSALVAFCVKTQGAPAAADVANACSVNLMVALLFRQENWVNLVYEIAVHMPHSLPLSIRKRLAKVFHYGGVHSGCGTAAVVWFILYTAIITKNYIRVRDGDSLANLIMSYMLVALLCTILAAAHPTFRVKYHDSFEAGHRFAGWTALIIFWIHNVLDANVESKLAGVTLGHYIIHSVNFWCFLVSTSCTFLSWSRLRKREVIPEVLSDHAIRLHFNYRPMQPFYGLKISTRPLMEWHAFATIPDEDETGKINGFSVVVSNAGDWTRETIMNPPKKLWTRGYPLHGLLYTSRLFKRIVVVATGSGIGPCLSLLYADVTPRRVFWSTPNPEETYGTKIMKAVLKADPDALVWNTRERGRPDMVALTYQLVLESKAEAVFIISNPKLTHKVVYGMETRGIAAYGAIFDS